MMVRFNRVNAICVMCCLLTSRLGPQPPGFLPLTAMPPCLITRVNLLETGHCFSELQVWVGIIVEFL